MTLLCKQGFRGGIRPNSEGCALDNRQSRVNLLTRAFLTPLAFAAAAGSACALSLDGLELPWDFEKTFEESRPSSTYGVPAGPYGQGAVPKQIIDGSIERTVLRIRGGASTLELAAEFSEFFASQGFSEIYSCQTKECGGFDFLSGMDVAATPEMHVDLGDFRFLSVFRNLDSQVEIVELLASRGSLNGFAQITATTGAGRLEGTAENPSKAEIQPQSTAGTLSMPLARSIEENGHVVLEGLSFLSGAPNLENMRFPELEELAAFLNERPDAVVALVGHTDAIGSLDSNVSLSLQRARSVRNRLVEAHGVQSRQVTVQGVGYLAPRATNETEPGRMLNRRVEVVLMPKQ